MSVAELFERNMGSIAIRTVRSQTTMNIVYVFMMS